MNLAEHIYDLPSPPVLDVLGRWVFCRNARTGTTSMCEGPLHPRMVRQRQNPPLWETVKITTSSIFGRMISCQTFVRNPWDRICSSFYQCRDHARTEDNKISPKWSFTEWVRRVLAVNGPSVNRHFAEQFPTAYFHGKTFGLVGRFECLDSDWDKISQRIGVPGRLPKLNACLRGSYLDHYDDESEQIVGNIYRREINAFGYEFGK